MRPLYLKIYCFNQTSTGWRMCMERISITAQCSSINDAAYSIQTYQSHSHSCIYTLQIPRRTQHESTTQLETMYTHNRYSYISYSVYTFHCSNNAWPGLQTTIHKESAFQPHLTCDMHIMKQTLDAHLTVKTPLQPTPKSPF